MGADFAFKILPETAYLICLCMEAVVTRRAKAPQKCCAPSQFVAPINHAENLLICFRVCPRCWIPVLVYHVHTRVRAPYLARNANPTHKHEIYFVDTIRVHSFRSRDLKPSSRCISMGLSLHSDGPFTISRWGSRCMPMGLLLYDAAGSPYAPAPGPAAAAVVCCEARAVRWLRRHQCSEPQASP